MYSAQFFLQEENVSNSFMFFLSISISMYKYIEYMENKFRRNAFCRHIQLFVE